MSERRSIGGIWEKDGKYGMYLTLQVEIDGKKHNFIAFSNKDYVEGVNKPHWKIQENRPTNEEKVQHFTKAIEVVKKGQEQSFVNETDVPF
jgi:hypothetical protein